MKKALFSVILSSSALFAVRTNAQVYGSTLHADLDLGIKAGINYQMLTASPFVPAYNQGFTAGIFGGKHSKKAGYRVEVLISSAHYTTEQPVSTGIFQEPPAKVYGKGDFNAMYINVPVLAEIKLYKKIWFEIGPQYSYMMSFKDNNGQYTSEFKNDKIFKSGELSIDLGVTAKLPYNFGLGVRFTKGLTNISNNTYYRAYDAWTFSTMQATLSYNFMK